MLFIEIFLSIHCLLFISSWLIGGRWLANQPSFKLKLARLLLVSSVISPLIVHCLNSSHQPERQHYVSFDALQEYINQPILKPEPSPLTPESAASFSVNNMSYCQLFYLVFALLLLFRSYDLLLAMGRVRTLLAEAIPYRTSGKLVIKVSESCHIPFSLFLINKAYIVLPLSLLSSSKNVKIAIAHEGQHHRNGDCLWAYFIEVLRIIFLGNPGVTRWSRILSELQEFSCDEVLVGQPKISAHDYGHCLFEVVQTLAQHPRPSNPALAGTVGMALGKDNEDRSFIIRRISMLSTYPLNTAKSLLLGGVFAGVAILAQISVAYSAVGALTNSKGKEVDISHLDPKMQHIAEKEIKIALKRYHAKSGVIAIASAKTGDIIAFAESGKNQQSWKSRVFSPGSTIKPFIAAAAIDSGSSSETKSYDCRAPYSIEGQTFTDYYANKGPISLAEAIAKSSNVCLIKVSQEAGAAVIRKKLTEFGFDMNSWWQETNRSDELQLAMASVGENIPVTIDSLTKSYAILANKGRPFKKGEAAIISGTTLSSINHILENAVTNGNGKLAAIPGISVAGKTGTVGESVNIAQDKHLSLFAGYLPANGYAMVVVIEDGYLSKNGETLTSGGEVAAPVFRKVVMTSLNNPNQ
ncbi:cell division protein FtsI/penicillin-binding protein 2 [Legionella nautarum]|uniref:Cell division protein FtsI/penicillin-binding protein 2 n=1 Tax=Legionella nautarum TaxID=45070 RepID=A0A0W0WTP9_9GAMM|nr:M56 family metallopeptidase [Legionella nautarum]KTD35696.1 cell division protein FtsI/penicillin-binding protein 2 [Legionella nautarum]